MGKKIFFYCLLIIIEIFILLISNGNSLSLLFTFSVHTIIFILIVLNIFLEYKSYKDARIPFFLLPPTIFSLFVILKIIIGGYLTFFGITWKFYHFNPSTFILADIISIFSVHFVYLGYSLLSFKFYRNKQLIKVPKKSMAYLFSIIPLMATIIGLRTGDYGYFGNASANSNAFIQFIKVFAGLGSFIIIYLTYYFYNSKQEKRQVHLLVFLFFVLGLFYGHKSTAVIVIFNFILTLYYKKRKINIRLIYILFVGIFAAYLIVQPMRIYMQRYKNTLGNKISFVDVVKIFTESRNLSTSFRVANSGFVFESFLSRNNYMEPLSMAIENKNSSFVKNHIKGGWEDMLLSPLYAFIPRLIWKSKPRAELGKYFSAKIYGSTMENSIGFTSQGYLFLLNGILGVIIGSFIIGMFMKFITQLLFIRFNNPVVFLVILLNLSSPTDLLWSYFAGIFQMLFVYLIISGFLFKGVQSRILQKVT